MSNLPENYYYGQKILTSGELFFKKFEGGLPSMFENSRENKHSPLKLSSSFGRLLSSQAGVNLTGSTKNGAFSVVSLPVCDWLVCESVIKVL